MIEVEEAVFAVTGGLPFLRLDFSFLLVHNAHGVFVQKRPKVLIEHFSFRRSFLGTLDLPLVVQDEIFVARNKLGLAHFLLFDFDFSGLGKHWFLLHYSARLLFFALGLLLELLQRVEVGVALH